MVERQVHPTASSRLLFPRKLKKFDSALDPQLSLPKLAEPVLGKMALPVSPAGIPRSSGQGKQLPETRSYPTLTGKRHPDMRKCTGQTTVSVYIEPIVPAIHPGP